MDETTEKYRAALVKIRHEVEHKHGGPELSDCVSVTYLYKTVMDALGYTVDPACERCGIANDF